MRALVFLSGFTPEAGEPFGRFLQQFPTPLGTALSPEGDYVYIDVSRFRDVFAADLPEKDARDGGDRKPPSGAILGQAPSAAAWRTIPSWYLITLQDCAISPELQRLYAQRMNARVTELRSSHVSLLSHPRDVARLIVEAAETVSSGSSRGRTNTLRACRSQGTGAPAPFRLSCRPLIAGGSMPELRSEREAARAPTDRRVEPDAGPIPYPVDQVVAIIDTPAQAAAALHALTGGGFLTSEVTLVCGAQAADRLHASSGRAGLFGRMLRAADRLGVWDEELEARHEYEQALRGGGFDFAVLAPTEERKQLAARILRAHGGHFINYFGRLTIQRLE